MIRILSILLTLLFSNVVYGLAAKSTVILLSVDGLSYNYLQKYKPNNILAFAESGVKARLLPVYPSKTFPNHLSIITGSYPVNHGIIHNRFYHPELDEEYYLGAGKHNDLWLTATPFWSLVEDNLIKSAVYFWPESESKKFTPPSYNIPYNKSISNRTRVDQLITWLKLPNNQRPYFIASYFSTIDSAAHGFGLDSPQLIKALYEFDKLFGYLLGRIKTEIDYPVNIILVSDHGMVPITEGAKVLTSSIFRDINTSDDLLKITYSDTQVFIYFNKKNITHKTRTSIKSKLRENRAEYKKNYRIYGKGNFPHAWNFNTAAAIVPDLIIEAIPPATFHWKNRLAEVHGSTHGFDPTNNNRLHGVFIAAGSNIIKGRGVQPFKNIHIFPFMSSLLGMNEGKGIDGKKSVLKSIIK